MPQTTATTSAEPTPDRAVHHGGELFITRVRLISALVMAALLFWYVGQWAVPVYDPQGPISLLLVNHGVIAMAKLLGLAVVTSGLAVAICGEGSADRGPLAIGVGLAALSLRGWQLDRLVLYFETETSGHVNPFPAWELIAECWLWLALIGVGFVAGRWVESWFTRPTAAPRPDRASDVRQGIGTIAVTALVAWAVLAYTIGNDVDPIYKGQIYFSVGLAFWVGGLVAHGVLRTTSRVWGLVAVPIVVTVAYVLGSPDGQAIAAAHGAYLNIKPIARPLPIEFAAMGSVGILLEADGMCWLRSMFGLSA